MPMNASGTVRLARTPETKYTPTGTMNVEISGASDVWYPGRNGEQGQNKANWFKATVWGKDAERIDKMAQEGKLLPGVIVYISGKFECREFTKNDGSLGYSLELKNAVVEPVWDSVNAQMAKQAGGQQQDYQQQQGPQGYVPPNAQPQQHQQGANAVYQPPQQYQQQPQQQQFATPQQPAPSEGYYNPDDPNAAL